MNKTLLFCCALLALAAPTAFADVNGGLDLTAVACFNNATPPASSTFKFDCSAPGIPQTLYGCFFVTTAQDSFVGLDAALQLCVSGPSLPDWWHFEPGGCDSGGVQVDLVRNPGLCQGARSTWGTGGVGGVTFQPRTFGGGDFAVTVARSTPFKLNANTYYFAFNLNFFSDNATQSGGACDGCDIAANLVWNSASLTNIRAAAQTGAEAEPYPISGPGLFSNCVTWGNGIPICFSCMVVPTRNRTWGQLKSLYR